MPGLEARGLRMTSGSRGKKGDERRRACLSDARKARSIGHVLRSAKARSRIGRTVQVHVRAAVRTNQAACRRKRQFLGTCSKPKSPSRAERGRKLRPAAVQCIADLICDMAGHPPYAVTESGVRGPCADAETAHGDSHASAGAPGSCFPPSRSAQPLRAEGKTTDDRRALWPDQTRGDDARP